MKNENNVILEIAVDRQNEKGVFIAKEMLSTLHDIINNEKKSIFFWKNKRPIFRFFIVHTKWRVRFFFEVPKKHENFFESQLYAHYSNIEISRADLPFEENEEFFVQESYIDKLSTDLIKLYINLKDRTEKETIDPISPLTSVLSKWEKNETAFFRVDFSPIEDFKFRTWYAKKIIEKNYPNFIKKFLLNNFWWLKIVSFPFILIVKIFGFFIGWNEKIENKKEEENVPKFETFGYSTRIIIASQNSRQTTEMWTSLNIFSSPNWNKFANKKIKKKFYFDTKKNFSIYKSILSVTELAGIVHMPTIYVKTPGINWVITRRFEPPHNLPPAEAPNTPIGISNFRGSKESFGIQPVDRARHTYIIGKTGMGKSTLLENMIYSDILAGRGVGLIDPHGDLAETILRNIPKSRTNDIVLFDPADVEYPIAFNMLESPSPELRPIVGSGLVSIFKKMFADSWGPRLEYILRNTILTLLRVPEATLVSIPLILTNEGYRKRVVAKLDDPLLVQFWNEEFDKMTGAMLSEAVNPILNKVGQFLSSPILRNILGQPKNPFSMRWVMDNGKIFIVNLSKWRIGEDSSALLGSMMVTKFQIEAMTRADIPESQRRDFGLYVDEFQNFATDSFATILSEARKYKLSLTMANQYIAQMADTVQGAVFGNVGSIISFQVGQQDATVLSEMFGWEDIILPNDLTNLRKYDIYTKLLIDGMPSQVFSATTFAPLTSRIDNPEQQSYETLMKVSREKYTKKRDFVEKKIFEYAGKIRDEEIKYRKQKAQEAEKIKEKKAEENRIKMEERLKARGITPYANENIETKNPIEIKNSPETTKQENIENKPQNNKNSKNKNKKKFQNKENKNPN